MSDTHKPIDSITLTIGQDGSVRAIYRDELVRFRDMCATPMVPKRASHVEPDENGLWVADMSPVGGPKLEPCVKRKDALKLEVDWLEGHNFGRKEL